MPRVPLQDGLLRSRDVRNEGLLVDTVADEGPLMDTVAVVEVDTDDDAAAVEQSRDE